jgi:hypothetical protein
MKCTLFQIDKTKETLKINKNYYDTFIIPLQSSHFVEEDNLWKSIFKHLKTVGVQVRCT